MKAYSAVLAHPGAALFSLAALIGRFPSSMAALGIVLLVQERTGSYGRAGLVSAAYVLALAAFAPLHGRLADRWGQSRVLGVSGAVYAVGITALLLSVHVEATPPLPHLAAALAGLATPQAGAMVRARWTHVLRADRERLPTAFALEAVLDEVVFVVGPVLVTFLTLSVAPYSGLAVAGLTGTLGAWAFAVQRGSEPPAARRGPRDAVAMGWGVLGPVMLAALGMGAMFGSMEVVVVAFATEEGQRSAGGVVLAVWAAGSLIAGVLVGALPAGDPVGRLRWTTVALVGLFAPLFVVPNLIWFTAAMFLAGFMIAPTLIAAVRVVELYVHPARLTEAMAWISTALAAGVALGAAVVGWVVDTSGSRPGFAVPLVAAALAAAVAWSVRPGPPPAPDKKGDHAVVSGPVTD